MVMTHPDNVDRNVKLVKITSQNTEDKLNIDLSANATDNNNGKFDTSSRETVDDPCENFLRLNAFLDAFEPRLKR